VSSSISSSKSFFISFVASFTTACLIFLIGSEIIVRSHVIPTSDYEKIRTSIHSFDRVYVAFADSHGANGLLENRYLRNFSMRGDDLMTISAKAEFVLSYGSPKGVILPADGHQFSNYRLQSNQESLRADLFNDDTHLFAFLRPIYRQYLIEYWRSFLLSLLGIRPMNHRDIKGRIPRITDNLPTIVDEDAKIRVQLHTPIQSFSSTAIASKFEVTIQKILKKNIKLCLVRFPVSSYYRKAASTITSFNETSVYFEGIALENQAQFLDYWSELPDKFFSDPDHLNTDGAKSFTKIVMRDCFGVDI